MPRINPVNPDQTTDKAQQLLDKAKAKLGGVPNLLKTFAHSHAALEAYLNLSGALSGGQLNGKTREQIALAIGQTNNCDYCVAAHTAIGKSHGLTEEQTVAARKFTGVDDKTTAILTFARKVVDERGWVSDQDLAAARNAGVTDAEITEVVANVALNIYTNYMNHVADTDVDFPAPPSAG